MTNYKQWDDEHNARLEAKRIAWQRRIYEIAEELRGFQDGLRELVLRDDRDSACRELWDCIISADNLARTLGAAKESAK